MVKNKRLFAKSLVGILAGLVCLAFYLRFKDATNIETFFSPQEWEALFILLAIFFGGLGVFGVMLSLTSLSKNFK